MIEMAEFLHYGVIVATVAITVIGVGIGGGIASQGAIAAINTQPSARSYVTRIAVLGMALLDTAAILGIVVAIILFRNNTIPHAYPTSIAELGIAFAICLPGFVIGLVSSFPVYTACLSVARQPFLSQKILRFMLITQTLIQTPIIFGFIIALFINIQAAGVTTVAEGIQLMASGLCMGLGSIGPAIGMAQFAKTACRGIGINRNAYSRILTFTFLSEAIIETPIIFSLLIAGLIITSPIASHDPLLTSIAFISAALATGLGTMGPGISSGKIASASCKEITHNPELYGTLSRASLFGTSLIDTCAIYALLISIMLIVWI